MFKGLGELEPASGVKASVATETPREARLLCAACRHPITTDEQRIAIGGGHQHTFTNPHQITYRIGCFRNAPGCGHVGAATDEFTWFAGYRWRVAVCGGCGGHVGWGFQKAGGSGFHGLILDQLTAEKTGY